MKFSKMTGIGAMGAGVALFSFSTVLCNTENLKEFVACDANELQEGAMKKVQVGADEENYILISKVNGQIYATGGKCSHYGAPLNYGYLDGFEVVCPWHTASFDVRSGEISQSPGLDAIPSYQVKLVGGKVVVMIPESKFSKVADTHASKRLVKRDPKNNECYVVIGGGAAGASAVETLRKEGFTGRIVLVTQENILPYDRTVLSKNFKVDSSDLELKDKNFYSEYSVEVSSGSEVVEINQDSRIVKLKNGNKLNYDKLLIATGCKAKVPGPYRKYAQNFSNVFTIRSADDHTKIRGKVEKSANVIIIGAGFLGLEAAKSIKTTWPEKNVTIIDVEERPLANILGREISDQLIAVQRMNGVEVFINTKIESIEGKDGVVSGVVIPSWTTFSGKSTTKEIKADLILLATGAEVCTSFVPPNLLNSDGSVKVNSHLNTQDTSIYAAGDIAQFPSYITEARERIEHWAVAQQQGRVAALNMAEKRVNYFDIPFFWSNQFINVSCAGFTNGHDWTYTETKDEDSPMKTARITYFYKGDTCIGAAAVNWPGAIIRLKIALRKGLMPSKKDLTSKKASYATIAERVNKSNRACGSCCGKN